MAFALMDDQIHGHPKFARAGLDAIGLWSLCLSYCSAYLTDGFVAREVAERFAGKQLERLAHRLVTCGDPGRPGLWDIVEGGWQMHDYLDWNPSRDEVLEKRQAERDRKQRGRSGQGRDASGRITSARNPAGQPADARAEGATGHTGSHAHAHAHSPTEEANESAHARARVGEPEEGKRTFEAFLQAWRSAGLPTMVDSLELHRLHERVAEAAYGFEAFCRSFKAITDHWRANGAPNCGASPTLAIDKADQVELHIRGEYALEPGKKGAPGDLKRGQVPVARGLDYSNGGVKP